MNDSGGLPTRSNNKLGCLVLSLVVIAPALYLGHLYRNYRKIQDNLTRRAAENVEPVLDVGSIAENGYIFQMRREENIREADLNFRWFIVIPQSDIHYGCEYQAGYTEFQEGESVGLVHPKSDDGGVGYIIGTHGRSTGKVAKVWTYSTEDLDPLNTDE